MGLGGQHVILIFSVFALKVAVGPCRPLYHGSIFCVYKEKIFGSSPSRMIDAPCSHTGTYCTSVWARWVYRIVECTLKSQHNMKTSQCWVCIP